MTDNPMINFYRDEFFRGWASLSVYDAGISAKFTFTGDDDCNGDDAAMQIDYERDAMFGNPKEHFVLFVTAATAGMIAKILQGFCDAENTDWSKESD